MEKSKLDNEMTFAEDAYYFAHYANMARHNAYLILNHINKSIFGNESTLKEENLQIAIIKILDPKNGADHHAKAIKLLNHHFPFIACYYKEDIKKAVENSAYKEMNDKKLDHLKEPLTLKQILKTLTGIRNELNHYGYSRKEHPIPFFQDLFNDSIQLAKKRMIEFNETRFNSIQDSPYHKMVDPKDSVLTDTGKLFFLCLFLDKKNAFEMLAKVKGFKNRTDEKYRATLECYTQLCCKTPYPKLESSDISLDILNELNRCPNALYQVLSEEDKLKFKKEPNEETAEELNPIMKRYDDRSAYLALRYFDRTKCLDNITFHLQLGRKVMGEPHKKVFDGKERTHQILKEMRVHDKLSTYETEEAQTFFQSKIESNEVELFAPHYRMVGNRIGLSFGTPSEKKEGYSIPINNQPAPQAILSTSELGALYIYNRLYKENKITQSPKNLMSTYLQTMNRFIKDWKNDGIKPETSSNKIIKERNQERTKQTINELKRRTDHLQKLLDEKYAGLKVKHLPDICREHLLNYQSDDNIQQAIDFLKKTLSDTNFKKKQLEQFERNMVYRSSNSKQLKIGEIAQELARDIVFFLKPIKKEITNRNKEKVTVFQKINNQDFDILQNRLAYFSLYKEELCSFFDDLLKKKHMKHPFLENVKAETKWSNGLIEFYLKYLEHKLKWLNTYTKNAPNNTTRPNYTTSNRINKNRSTPNKKDEIEEKEIDPEKIKETFIEKYNYFLKVKTSSPKNYQGKAIFIPVGLFNDAITKAMKESGYQVEDDEKTPNAAYWIKSYFHGATQPFYQLPRYYNRAKKDEERDLVEAALLKKEIKNYYVKANKKTQNDFKQLAKRIRKQEEEILTQQTSDRVLFMMATDLLNGGSDGRQTIECEQINTLGFNLGENKILDENRKVSMNIYGRKVVSELPIKRYGEFRRFMKDRRLENLINYFPEGKDIELGVLKSGEVEAVGERFSSSTLANELEFFDSQRWLLMKSIYEFEKKIYTHFFDVLTKNVPEKEMMENNYIAHYHYIECAKKLELSVSELEKDDFKELRNKIQHNEIPYSQWIKNRISTKDGHLITKQIVELVLSIYQQMNNELDQLIRK
ncbi:MAG: hypothetical protein EOM31_02990 [Bacteroidia bacterium]|nr:hypothetical protein [Bacteroidia bacterium]